VTINNPNSSNNNNYIINHSIITSNCSTITNRNNIIINNNNITNRNNININNNNPKNLKPLILGHFEFDTTIQGKQFNIEPTSRLFNDIFIRVYLACKY